MKRISVFLIIIIVLSSSIAYANFDKSIEEHWSKQIIEKNFAEKYFPYLVEENFSKFKPNNHITVAQFSRSISLLFQDHNYKITDILNEGFLSREKMLNILGSELENIGILADKNVDIPFKDTNTMDESNIELLKMLYKLEIIQGDTNTQFSPERRLSQAEAVIILQRAREVLKTMDTVSFETLGVVQTFNGEEEITVIPQEEKVLVTITKQFPTPGYNMSVSHIVRSKDGHKIKFHIKPPEKDSIQLQVITYKTISLEIDKKDLGDMPYNFILDGYNKI